ncbi:TraM recognition domain-containing protein [Helicobacter sp. 12S02232-10]|uniref:TraM recognition domain-containing protein n=1 Tax=Helicobacter sp. 12S02232-10 TaxID=1476197 RepID=UPI000BA6E56F|nr:TraM recognition domain-containing protein [Helicobacter sp. 12S02232-10]
MDHTHTINPLLSGGVLVLYEILIALLEGEENEWKAKQKEYMTLSKLVREALDYRDCAYKSNAIVDFIQYVSSSIAIDYKVFLSDRSAEFDQKALKQAENTDLQGVYDASMAAQAWRGIITNLKSDYGRVFNTQTPDISMWEAVQRNKILFVTLPTMASDTTPKELGRLILGLIKGVADEKARKAKEPDIPFVVLADEVGSYICDGFGRLMSKSRALGIAMWLIFQSFAQLDVVGKLLSGQSAERQEIASVIGTHILMKNTDPEATKYYQDFALKKVVMEKSYSERRDYAKGQIGPEQNFSSKEIPAFEHSDIVKMNNGEMIVLSDGQMYKAIAQAESSLLESGKKITYEGNQVTKPLPISEYLSKKDFFKIMNEFKNKRAV